MKMTVRSLQVVFLVMLSAAPAFAAQSKVRELTQVQGVRDNELFGYGLVVGLAGTGDTERVFFTSQSISGMLARLGIRVAAADVRSRNVAAVMVTARLPTFSRQGNRIDVTVSSMGNARSLAGGTLLLTPLMAADGQVYAVGQGGVQVGGYDVRRLGTEVAKNQTTSGRVPSGAIIEKTFAPDLNAGPLILGLKRADLSTAVHIAAAIEKKFGEGSARALDPAAVEVKVPDAYAGRPLLLLAELEMLEVEVDVRARIVVNERTGTVVAGESVRLRPATIAHGGLQIAITQSANISQPGAFARVGNTAVVPFAEIGVNEQPGKVLALPATASVEELARALNALGVTPRDLISILQALHAAGAIDADLEVM